MPLKKIVFLVGPTAVGKSAAAIALARKLGAEIISCDSMQVYKGMDIITSKPAAALRKKIKHHLLGTVSPTQEYDVSRYRLEALKKMEGIIKKGRVPLFCGGTGLYVSILLHGIFKDKPGSAKARKELYRRLKKYGKSYLYKRLKHVDPQAAKKIHPNDVRRIIRALEVFEATGKPISGLQKQREGLDKYYKVKVFCLNMKRDALYKRIDGRVDNMFKAGLLKEVNRLLKKKLSRTSSYAIGLQELKDYLEGRSSLEEAASLMKRNTRRYAKRQLTWFRKDKSIQWINVRDKDTPAQIAERLWKELY